MQFLHTENSKYFMAQYAQLLTLVLTISVLPLHVQSKNCASVEGIVRVCISIQNCPSLLQLLSPGIISRNDLRKLQKLTCGFDKHDAKVCCPVNELIEAKPRDKPLDLSYRSHVNYKNLPTHDVCGTMNATLEVRIIGGRTPQQDAQPWLVRLGFNTADKNAIEYHCGGSIINQRYILTAAHCVSGENDLPIVVRVGEYDTSSDPDCSEYSGKCSYAQDVAIEKIIHHSGYSLDTKLNDIALIRLAEDLTFDEFVRPICLPLEDEFRPVGLRLTDSNTEKSKAETGFVAGWGATKWDVQGHSQVVQIATLPVVPNERCQAIYRGRAVISSKQLCAGGEAGKDSCDGDSGGPLIFNSKNIRCYFQVGIVSYGPTRCGSNGLPGIYTRVTEYISWILDHLEE